IHLSNPVPASHSTCDRLSFRTEEQQARTDRLAYATSVGRYIADLKWGEREGHAITTSPHHSKDNSETLRASGFSRPRKGAQEGRAYGDSDEVSREIKSAKRRRKCEGILGVYIGKRVR